MPRIAPEKKTRTELFNQLQSKSIEHKDSNDCAVKAIAVVTGCSYELAHQMLANQGRKRGCGTFTRMTHEVIRRLGFKLELIDHMAKRALYSQKTTCGYVYKNITTHHFAKFPEAWKDGNTYLVSTPGHVLGVIDGTVHDWTVGRSKHLISVYKVTRV